MPRYLNNVFTNETSQREAVMGRETEQVRNNAGGYVFPVTPEVRLDRFLILGSEAGTYYASEAKLTKENAKNALAMIQKDDETGAYVVNRVVELANNRAPKIGPPLFVLAMAASFGTPSTQAAAFKALPTVARTASHLFQFIEFADSMRGWGRAMKRAINEWYTEKSVDDLAYQVVKYRNRNNWTHRDVLRKSHPISYDHNNLFGYMANKPWVTEDENMRLVNAFEAAKTMTDTAEIVAHIEKHNLTWEMLPTEALQKPEVWKAMLPNMPATALMRNLGRLTKLDVLKPLSNTEDLQDVIAKFSSADWVKRSRLHPLNILLAYHTYREGGGYRGKLTWDPVTQIADALEEAYEHSFQNVKPTNKNIYVGLDVSGSMGARIFNSPLSAREASAALAMIIARTEPNHHIAAFASGNEFKTRRFMGTTSMRTVNFSKRDSLRAWVERTSRIPMGGTDCAIPMLDAINKKLDVDCFVILTDGETWAGNVHPFEAIKKYRKEMNKPQAKVIVVAMTSTGFTLADPNDAGMMDMVGFDSAMPQIIRDFIVN